MGERPMIDINLDKETFLSYYYLKEELIDFCRNNNIPVTGGKIEITNRIAHYLETGEILHSTSSAKVKVELFEITVDMQIEPNFVCSEVHRAFFKKEIGKSFSFNVAFQKWLKDNTGKTYKQAIEAYYQIAEDKKGTKTTIDKQFEYNTYIRDFFIDTEGLSLEDAIKCWKYKKSLPGHNRYDKSDLVALN